MYTYIKKNFAIQNFLSSIKTQHTPFSIRFQHQKVFIILIKVKASDLFNGSKVCHCQEITQCIESFCENSTFWSKPTNKIHF